MNINKFTYPCPWEEKRWERKDYDPVRRAYITWLKRYPWDLFVSVNFRQNQIDLKKKVLHEKEMYLKNVTFAPWGSPSDVEYRLKVMDARVCKELLGRKWASKTSERPEWVGFMEKDEDGYAHAHILVNLKDIDRVPFIIAFIGAARYFSPRADIRPKGAFKEIYAVEGAIDYMTEYLKSTYKECALVASPTFRKSIQIKQGTASSVDDLSPTLVS